jgi:hypothetical protein
MRREFAAARYIMPTTGSVSCYVLPDTAHDPCLATSRRASQATSVTSRCDNDA